MMANWHEPPLDVDKLDMWIQGYYERDLEEHERLQEDDFDELCRLELAQAEKDIYQ